MMEYKSNQESRLYHLKFPHNSVVIVEIVLRSFPPKKFKCVEPLSEALVVVLTLQLVRKYLTFGNFRYLTFITQ